VDTITHGIAGALISKAVFGGRDSFSSRSLSKQRVITWSLMLGAIFPDSDVVREFFSHNPMLMLTWHRSITHSLLCLPIWAVILAGLTRVVVKWRKWEGAVVYLRCAASGRSESSATFFWILRPRSNDDLVAARVVASCLGLSLHCGFQLHGHSA